MTQGSKIQPAKFPKPWSKGRGVSCRWQPKDCEWYIAFAATITLLAPSAIAQDSITETILGCTGKLYTKHYHETADSNAVMRIKPSSKQVTITTLERVGVYGADETVTWKDEEQKDTYSITLNGDDFLVFERNIYDENLKVWSPRGFIPISEDDVARGSLNKRTGSLDVVTEYYDTKVASEDGWIGWASSFLSKDDPLKYAFGWKMEMTCKEQ